MAAAYKPKQANVVGEIGLSEDDHILLKNNPNLKTMSLTDRLRRRCMKTENEGTQQTGHLGKTWGHCVKGHYGEFLSG